jgi:hypothetical protein
MKKTILITTALMLLPLFVDSVDACSCLRVTICDAYKMSPAIFVGTVLESKDIEKDRARVYRFTVEQSYKGVEGTDIEVQTGMGGGDCGYSFTKGERYLVYAYFDKKTRTFHTNICSRTTPLSGAAEDLDFLRGLPDSATKTRISGTITRITYDRDKYGNPTIKPMSGVKVVLKGMKTFESTTNDEGLYLFVGVPPGRYKLKAELSATLSNKEYNVTLPVAGCARLDIHTRAGGQTVGKVVDIEPIKILLTEGMKPFKLIAPVPNGK